jgi:hypothetical protein
VIHDRKSARGQSKVNSAGYVSDAEDGPGIVAPNAWTRPRGVELFRLVHSLLPPKLYYSLPSQPYWTLSSHLGYSYTVFCFRARTISLLVLHLLQTPETTPHSFGTFQLVFNSFFSAKFSPFTSLLMPERALGPELPAIFVAVNLFSRSFSTYVPSTPSSSDQMLSYMFTFVVSTTGPYRSVVR